MEKYDIFDLMVRNINKVQSAATNSAAASTIAAIKNRITDKYNFKRKDLTAHVRLIKASSQRPYASIAVRRKPLGLIYFSARQTQKGVSYTIEKGKRAVMRSAFITYLNGTNQNSDEHGQVMQRYGSKVKMTRGKHIGQMKQRIRKKTGKSIIQMFFGRTGQDLYSYMHSTFKEKFEKEFKRLSDLVGKGTINDQ